MRTYTLLLSALLVSAATTVQAQLIRYTEGGKIGYKTESGKLAIAPKFEAASDFKEGFAVILKGPKRGFINSKGEEVIPCQYEDASPFEKGLACVELGGRWGYINTVAQWAIQPIYENAFSFHNGLARVMRGGKWGMIDKNGTTVIPMIYNRLYDESEGVIAASLDGTHYGYITPDGKEAIAPTFSMAYPFDELTHRAVVTTLHGNYYINSKGALVGKVFNKEEEEEKERRSGKKEQGGEKEERD